MKRTRISVRQVDACAPPSLHVRHLLSIMETSHRQMFSASAGLTVARRRAAAIAVAAAIAAPVAVTAPVATAVAPAVPVAAPAAVPAVPAVPASGPAATTPAHGRASLRR